MNEQKLVLVTAGALIGASVSFGLTRFHYQKIHREEIIELSEKSHKLGYDEGRQDERLAQEELRKNEEIKSEKKPAKIENIPAKLDPKYNVDAEKIARMQRMINSYLTRNEDNEIAQEEAQKDQEDLDDLTEAYLDELEKEEDDDQPDDAPEDDERFVLGSDVTWGTTGFTRMELFYVLQTNALALMNDGHIITDSMEELENDYGYYIWGDEVEAASHQGEDMTVVFVIDREEKIEYKIFCYLTIEEEPDNESD